MKTNNRLSKDNNTHEQKVRPMVKVIETRWSGKDNGIIQTEGERPMNDTEYIEYLEKENQELKEENSLYTLHLSDRKMTKWESKVWNLISNKYCSTMGQYSLVGLLVLIEKLDNKVKTQQDQFLKVVESVVKKYEIGKNEIHYVVGTQFKSSGNMVVAVIKEEYRKELLQEIKSAMEKEGE